MRDIFDDVFKNQPLDPNEAARRSLRRAVRKRFYQTASIVDGALALDGRPVKTPAGRPLAAPAPALAEAIAEEWRAQHEVIDPSAMPLTRLANSIIDGVSATPEPVAAEVEKYLASDLLCYRASAPDKLVTRQRDAWDPLIAWARRRLGARFEVTDALVHVVQPAEALVAAGAAIPREADAKSLWRLGALNSITTLTGSALLALAVLHGRLSADQAWTAAHVDEDWNMEFWGKDTLALERRAYRFAEMQAAAKVLELLSDFLG